MEEQIKDVITKNIRPALQMDGGDIDFVAFKDGVVEVRLKGACCGCPHAAMTLHAGVERMLKEKIPGITGVKNVA